ncbi:MFS general substrate transporter [Pyrenochaeta sp. DS3sAY3a]|nr:MFS general substrate transporter [Pyrenochaeta sp. DS3sAY3a]
MLLRTRIPSNPRASLLVDWRGFKDFRFVLTMSAIFVLDWAVLVPPAYITTYASSTGSHIISNHILMILNAASIIGRGFPGLIADRIGRFNIMIVCSAASTASIFGLWLNANSNVPVLVLFAVVYGLFSGPAYSLTPVCVAQLCRPDEYASKYGIGVGNGNNYSALISFCGAAYATSTMLFVFARGRSIGWKLNEKF